MAKITVEVDHRQYDDPITYEGVSLSIIEGLSGPLVRLDKEGDDMFTVHRLQSVKSVTVE